MYGNIIFAGWFTDALPTILMIGLVVLVFFFMFRSQKKQEKEANDMRNNLQIGDEVTTIGGIIGEIVRIKEETVTIETGKDRTKIRVLRTAIRSVDVHATDKFGTAPAPAQEKQSPIKVEKVKTTKKSKKEKAEEVKNAESSAETNAVKTEENK